MGDARCGNPERDRRALGVANGRPFAEGQVTHAAPGGEPLPVPLCQAPSTRAISSCSGDRGNEPSRQQQKEVGSGGAQSRNTGDPQEPACSAGS